MLYPVIQSIITSTLLQFHCPNCGKKSNEDHVSIAHITENHLDLVLDCPECHSHTQMHAEVANFPMESAVPGVTPNQNALKDTDIHAIEQGLEGASSVEDFLT